MRKAFIVFALIFFCSKFYSQNLYDYKVKTISNLKDRARILDVLRSELKKDYDHEFIFRVNKLNISVGFAWFEGYVRRKDGKDLLLEPYEDSHVKALLQMENKQWNIIKIEAFLNETDWEYIFKMTNAPRKIFFY